MAKSLFLIILGFFKLFGLVPYWTFAKSGSQLALQKVNVFIVLTLLVIYWIAIIQSFWTQVANRDSISKVSNWMQLIVNAISLSTILLRPIIAVKIFKRIHTLFEQVDGKLSEFGIKLKNRHLIICVAFSITFFAIYVTFIVFFDFYVSLIKYNFYSRIYWTISIFPMIIYSAAIWYALCLFICIFFRIKFCNKIMKSELKLRFVI